MEGKTWGAAEPLTVPLQQVWVGMFLAYVGEGAHERDAVAELLLVLVVMPLQHGFPDLLHQGLVQLSVRHHAVDDHI